MTLNEAIEKMSMEIAEQCEADEKKFEVFTNLTKCIEGATSNGGKVNACELFDACDALVKTFPEYTSALIAFCFMGKIGMDLELVDYGNAGELNLDDVTNDLGIDEEEG